MLLRYYILFHTIHIISTIDTITINASGHGVLLKKFWKNTGLCPPDPKNGIDNFLLSNDEKLNIVYIGALPNKAISYIRIHWLLNLIKVRNGSYDFLNLNKLLDWIHDQKLYPDFEIMGVPQNLKNQTNQYFLNYNYWYDLIITVVKTYLNRYGIKYLQRWRFETWNEPDLKNYNILNFTLPDYLLYVQASSDALKVFKEQITNGKGFKLGGPAGLFKDPSKHTLCWGLLSYCNKIGRRNCPIQYITFHKKGDGTTEEVLNKTLQLVNLFKTNYSNMSSMSIANDEADILTNWSKSEDWRGDVRYAAMVVKVIIDYYKELVLDNKIKLKALSNDNGFINYHPYYFTQRTLLARFQLNKTSPPHIQFIKKPVYAVMGLLSLLGEEYLQDAVSSYSSIDFLATRSTKDKSQILALLVVFSNNTREDKRSLKSVRLMIKNMPNNINKYIIYVLNNFLTNPFAIWKSNGSPVFPTKNIFQKTSKEPYRLIGPSEIVNSNLEVHLNLTLPSVALINVCSKTDQSPGRVTHLNIYNITWNEILIVWKDNKVNSRCILTYEVEFKSENSKYRRINVQDTIMLSHQHVASGDSIAEGTYGKYRVRAVDYWNRPGKYSKCESYPSI